MFRCLRCCILGETGDRKVAAPEDRRGAHREILHELIHAFQSDFSGASIKHAVRSKVEDPPLLSVLPFQGGSFCRLQRRTS